MMTMLFQKIMLHPSVAARWLTWVQWRFTCNLSHCGTTLTCEICFMNYRFFWSYEKKNTQLHKSVTTFHQHLCMPPSPFIARQRNFTLTHNSPTPAPKKNNFFCQNNWLRPKNLSGESKKKQNKQFFTPFCRERKPCSFTRTPPPSPDLLKIKFVL